MKKVTTTFTQTALELFDTLEASRRALCAHPESAWADTDRGLLCTACNSPVPKSMLCNGGKCSNCPNLHCENNTTPDHVSELMDCTSDEKLYPDCGMCPYEFTDKCEGKAKCKSN